MKFVRAITLILIMTVILLISVTAYAASGPDPTTGLISDYLTWQFLGTMAGAVAATTLIVQFLKMPLDKVWKVRTRFVVYFIALIILFAVEFFTGKVTPERAALIILNAIIVATAAMGTYEATFKNLENKPPS